MPKSFISRGFTLVELMVVIGIISILASVGLATYTNTQRSGRDTKRKSDIIEIQKALEQYYLDIHHYPDEGTGHTVPATLDPYFSEAHSPTDPQTGHNYYYVKGGSYGATVCAVDTYNVCASLEDQSKGNRGIGPSSGCEKASDDGDFTYPGHFDTYCAGHLSN